MQLGKQFILFSFIGLVACTEQSVTDLAIDGGDYITPQSENKIDGVVRISMGGSGLCTGTIVGPRTVLTAAHCIDDMYSTQSKKLRGEVCVKNALFDACATDARVPEQFYGQSSGFFGGSGSRYGYDAALLYFPPNSFNIYHRVAAAVTSGATVDMVGYSPRNNTEGIRNPKRWGRTQVTEFDDTEEDSIQSEGGLSFDSAALNSGDSGGPMFLECEVVGIASRGTNGRVKTSIHTNVTAANVLAALKALDQEMGGDVCSWTGENTGACAESRPIETVSGPIEKDANGEPVFPCLPSGGARGLTVALAPTANDANLTFLHVAFPKDIPLSQGFACLNTGAEACLPGDPSALGLRLRDQNHERQIAWHDQALPLKQGDHLTITIGQSTRRIVLAR